MHKTLCIIFLTLCQRCGSWTLLAYLCSEVTLIAFLLQTSNYEITTQITHL